MLIFWICDFIRLHFNMRLYITLFCLVLTSISASGQGVFKGRVSEHKTRIPIPGTRVTNLSDRNSVLSDSSGLFAIKAKPGDLLLLRSFVYEPDTMLVTNMKFKEIFLVALQNKLEEVRVQQTEARNMAWIDREYHGQTVVYQVDKEGNHKGGLTFRLWYWNKDSRSKRKSQERMRKEEILLKIDRMFTPVNVKRFVPLAGEEMVNFIALYRPSIPEFTSRGFNFMEYLNTSYIAFKKLPADKRRLPELN